MRGLDTKSTGEIPYSKMFAIYSPIILSMGEMKRANGYEEERRTKDRFASTLVIAASIIAAARLARDENISRPSPQLTSVIADCVGLARMILEKVMR
jgi:hypothetical protein